MGRGDGVMSIESLLFFREEGDDFRDLSGEITVPTLDFFAALFFFLALFDGRLFHQGEAFLVEAEFGGVEVATAQGHDVGGEAVEAAQFGFGVVLDRGQGVLRRGSERIRMRPGVVSSCGSRVGSSRRGFVW